MGVLVLPIIGLCMASQLASNTDQFRCPKCKKWASLEYVGDYGVLFACSCARAASGEWFLPKSDVLGE